MTRYSYVRRSQKRFYAISDKTSVCRLKRRARNRVNASASTQRIGRLCLRPPTSNAKTPDPSILLYGRSNSRPQSVFCGDFRIYGINSYSLNYIKYVLCIIGNIIFRRRKRTGSSGFRKGETFPVFIKIGIFVFRGSPFASVFHFCLPFYFVLWYNVIVKKQSRRTEK